MTSTRCPHPTINGQSLGDSMAHPATRDYAVVSTSKREVAEMIACFNADWARKRFKPDPKSRLIWCPNDGHALNFGGGLPIYGTA